MKDMIEQIVSLDRREREITDEVQMERLSIEKEIADLKQQIKRDYLERARVRLKLNEKTEKKSATDAWKNIRAKQLRLSKKLDDLYSKKSEEWISTITEHVIGAQ